ITSNDNTYKKMKHPINIVKYSGDVVAFNVDKLINSLRRSQASEELIQHKVAQVETQLYDGISTKKIYQMSFKIDRKNDVQGKSVSVHVELGVRSKIKKKK